MRRSRAAGGLLDRGDLRRIRWIFALSAVLVVASFVVLLWLALRGVDAESAARYRTVAARVVDEMERELTRWLGEEELHSADEYRFLVSRAPDRIERSPLATEPGEPFILGRFEVDAQGSVSTPRWPSDEEKARELVGWAPSPEVRDEVAALEELVFRVWELWGGSLFGRPFADVEKRPSAVRRKGPATSASAVELMLAELNRGSDDRKSTSSAPGRDEQDGSMGLPPVAAPKVSRWLGWALPGQGLLLYRRVESGESPRMQGLVLDSTSLVRWLEEQVKRGAPDLEGVRAVPAAELAELAPEERAFHLRHALQAPFEGVDVVVALSALPMPAGAKAIRWLSGLLVLVSLLGLGATYRSVAIRVAFAERSGNFVSAVTHELRSPLASMRLHAEMLRDGVAVSEAVQERYTQRLVEECDRLERLVENVLEVARLEGDDRALEIRPAPIEPVIEEALRVVEERARREGIAIVRWPAVDDAIAPIDSEALLRVLLNLLDNALKFSRSAAEKKVEIGCREAGGGVEIYVGDRGPGVEERHLPHLFEPFYRGEAELVRRTTGVGLGLALSHNLVRRMGGAIRAGNRSEGGFEIMIRWED